jgi:hypothetical protein
MLVSDPEKMFKTKGYIKQMSALEGKVYQPNITQVMLRFQ